jgi:hypothetical protein
VDTVNLQRLDPKLSLSQSAKDHVGFVRDLAHNVVPTGSFDTRPTLCPTAGAKARFLLTEFHLVKIFSCLIISQNGRMTPEHDHAHSQLSEMELRVRALESVLTQKGYIERAALDLLIETYEKKIGPHNGARVVAKAWVDEEFKRRLAAEPTPAIASLGYAGWQGEHMFVVENTPQLHNMVVSRSRPPQSLELHVAAVFSVCGGPTRSRPRDRRR